MEGSLMALYSMYWEGLQKSDKLGPPYVARDGEWIVNPDRIPVSPAAMFRELLENTSDYYAFIITVKQWDGWEDFLCQECLYEFLHYEMPYFVTNHRYPTEGRKLRLVILKGKGKQ
jgi:hypothetical protein